MWYDKKEVITMTCPNCGAVYDSGCRFCGTCGTALTHRKQGSHLVPLMILLFLSVLGICIFCATWKPPAQPQSDTPWFTVQNGNLTFDKSLYDGGSELVVPATLDGQTVVWIDDSCFAGCDGLTVVTLPDTVEHIGVGAFADCGDLRAVDIPPAVITIGTNTFRNCGSLEAVHIPASVNYVGWDAFDGCGSLAYIFYDGTWARWNSVYGQELGPGITICCTDGNYYQAE